jgi:hypothetical protein
MSYSFFFGELSVPKSDLNSLSHEAFYCTAAGSSSDSPFFDYRPEHLDWSERELDQVPASETAQKLSLVTEEITSLDLSKNSLGRKAFEGFSTICAALPRHLKYLNLGDNALVSKSVDKVAEGFQGLPDLDALNLSSNSFYKIKGESLAKLLGSCPESTNGLDLSENDLYRMSGSELGKGLTGLKKGVASVNLSNNHFDQLRGQGLATAIAALPKTVTSVDVSNNDLDDAQVRSLFPVLKKSNIITFNVEGNPAVSTDLVVDLKAILKANLQKQTEKTATSGSTVNTKNENQPEQENTQARGRFSFRLFSWGKKSKHVDDTPALDVGAKSQK